MNKLRRRIACLTEQHTCPLCSSTDLEWEAILDDEQEVYCIGCGVKWIITYEIKAIDAQQSGR